MKIYRHIHGEGRVLTSKRIPSLHLPAEFVEADAFEMVLKRCGCLDQYDVVSADIRQAAEHDLNGKRVLVFRRGGFGDCLWISRIILKLQQSYPDASFEFASHPRHHMVFNANPMIREQYPYPIPLSAFEGADYHLCFENCIEPDRTGRSVYDLFAERAGIVLDAGEKIPNYTLPSYPGKRITRFLSDLGIKATDRKIMIHMGASSPWKSWHPLHVFVVAYALGQAGFKVFLAGNANVFPFKTDKMPNVIQCCYHERNGQRIDMLTMEETLTLMSRCELFIGPDSGLIHFSAALGVPAIAIYGPFPAKAYVSTYPNVTAIEPDPGVCDRQPCFPHMDNRCPRMDQQGFSECLNSVTPERVFAEIEKKLGMNVAAEFPDIKEVACH